MVGHESQIKAVVIDSPKVKHAAMKVLVGSEQGWDNHVMRIVELDEEGFSPAHSHPWPHINYMVEGEGVLMIAGEEHPVKEGSYAFVPADTHHQFRNAGRGMFRFICIVPTEGHV